MIFISVLSNGFSVSDTSFFDQFFNNQVCYNCFYLCGVGSYFFWSVFEVINSVVISFSNDENYVFNVLDCTIVNDRVKVETGIFTFNIRLENVLFLNGNYFV